MRFRTLTLLTITFAVLLLAALGVSVVASAQTTPQKPDAAASSQEQPLTQAERRGRAIYFRGETSS
jgi:hypothetical protein